MSTVTSGMISWVDLSTPDIEGAQRFYTALLGWELDVQHTQMGDYTVASAGGREAAGMMAQSAEMAGVPAVWTVFVVVDDLDATVTRVGSAGGASVQDPFEIPGGARVAVVADRTGAMIALISGGPEPGHRYYADDAGAVCWAELMTSDVEGAIGFYHAVFGWSASTDHDGPVPKTVCRLDDEPVAGIIGGPDDLPADVPDSWSVYFAVPDCKAAERRAIELRGSVIMGATPPPGAFAVLMDPAGAAFRVMESASASAGV